MRYGVYLYRVLVCLPFPKDQERSSIAVDTKNSKSPKKEIWDAFPMVAEFFIDEFCRKRSSFQLQIKITRELALGSFFLPFALCNDHEGNLKKGCQLDGELVKNLSGSIFAKIVL